VAMGRDLHEKTDWAIRELAGRHFPSGDEASRQETNRWNAAPVVRNDSPIHGFPHQSHEMAQSLRCSHGHLSYS
jgi:hypothetical protein